MSVTVVTGGVRSGKSRHAEALLAERDDVTYIATGQPAAGDDAEWRERVARHQAARPATWTTVETLDLVPLLGMPGGPLLVECLGTWVTGLVDRASLWDDLPAAAALVEAEGAALAEALTRTSRDVVLVTNEVGWSLVPLTPSGRFFTDALGRVNTAVAGVADHAVLVVLGRALTLGSL
ncbi:MAG TPA: bifunctional adenosylcobinamide kinase/adenosylcobinamide-phosphate guanylyltransferase [Dermatophilaceae bacterium]|nr:bifunctional adenosylcobinamide kinase/adenosylcobinamide-phosphate guanylyltransferase [Dermatophilaceae bacterium]